MWRTGSTYICIFNKSKMLHRRNPSCGLVQSRLDSVRMYIYSTITWFTLSEYLCTYFIVVFDVKVQKI